MGSILHHFSSAKSDGTDATKVQPSNWNAEHDFSIAHADLGSVGANDHHAKAHDHTTGDGSGVLTNDEHDGYSEFADISAPSSPASGKVRLCSIGGILKWKDSAGNLYDLSATGPSFATPAIVLGSSAAAGAAGTVIRSDSTIAAFDATAPVTQAFSDVAATGSAAFAARRDHKHGMPAASAGAYFVRRVAIVPLNTLQTVNVNSTSYVQLANAFNFSIDLDTFLPTHFRLVIRALSNAGGQTITCQAITRDAATTPIHTGGDDVVVTSTEAQFDSGWRTWDTPTSGFFEGNIAFKGSNSTVDISYYSVDIHFKK